MKRFKNILCHADGAVSHGQSLDRAVALAQSNNAALTVMDVVPKSDLAPAAEQGLDRNLSTLFRQRRLEELEVLVESHRRRGVRLYTDNVLQTTSASVLAVKPSGFVSPVALP